jgi:hypothetical protein
MCWWYLFQSWVRSSQGAVGATEIVVVGIAGARVSKSRRVESEETVEIVVEEWGEKRAL